MPNDGEIRQPELYLNGSKKVVRCLPVGHYTVRRTDHSSQIRISGLGLSHRVPADVAPERLDALLSVWHIPRDARPEMVAAIRRLGGAPTPAPVAASASVPAPSARPAAQPNSPAKEPTSTAEKEPSSSLFPKEWKDAEAPLEVQELNREFGVVVEGGRSMIWRPRREGGRIVYERLGERDFLLLYRNRTVQVLTPVTVKGKTELREKTVPVGKRWLEDSRRRTYRHTTFDPTPGLITPPDTLNLWRGFAVEPAPGRWGRFDEHLREVICGGGAEEYAWLRGWLARTLQRPDLRGEVAVVLKGMKGAGKGVVGNTLVRLFGQHGLHISNSRHLVGNFNAHLRDCAFLFADEAFWAGDKQGESVLKSLVTEPNLTIEAKYHDAVAAPNRLSILMASNSDWVVPASHDERRYFVLDVAGTHAGDYPYFAALHDELEAGGLAAFLHDMLAEDLTGFNHRDVPSTGALEQQIVQGLDHMDEWWYQRLLEGTPLGPDAPLGDVTGDWHSGEVTVTKKALHDDFIRFCEHHRYANRRGHPTRVKLGIRLRKLIGGGWPRDEWTSGARDSAAYTIPSFSECRRAFSPGRPGLFAAAEVEPSF